MFPNNHLHLKLFIIIITFQLINIHIFISVATFSYWRCKPWRQDIFSFLVHLSSHLNDFLITIFTYEREKRWFIYYPFFFSQQHFAQVEAMPMRLKLISWIRHMMMLKAFWIQYCVVLKHYAHRGQSGQAFHKWVPFIIGGLPDQRKSIITNITLLADFNPASASTQSNCSHGYNCRLCKW
jgi:hypothetical protein